MGQHIFSRCLCRQENTGKIHIQNLSPLFIAHLLRRHVQADPRIAESSLQAAQFSGHSIHHLLNLNRIGHIGLHGNHPSSAALRQLHGCLLRLRQIHIHDGQIRPRLRKGSGHTLPDPPGPAGDKNPFSVQSHALNNTHIPSPFVVIGLFGHRNFVCIRSKYSKGFFSAPPPRQSAAF